MNDFSDWTGAGLVTASKLFIIGADGKPQDVTEDNTYADLRRYLPGGEGSGPLYLVGRVAMTNGSGEKIVKLFANATWETKLLELFEFAEFKMMANENDPEHLQSAPAMPFNFGAWRTAGTIELFWHLPGPAKPTAKIAFTNGNQSVSAFWCWPE
jgi:hypothetical protein